MIALLLTLATASPDACDPAGTQQQLNACARNRYVQADRDLNFAWQRLAPLARALDKDMAKIRKPAFSRLLKSQRAWLTYREETCGWTADSFGGSISPLNYYNCMADLTEARALELQAMTKNPNSGEPL